MIVKFSVNHQANNLSYKKTSSIKIDKKGTNEAQFIYGKVTSVNEYIRGIILGSSNEEYHFKRDNIELGMNEIKKDSSVKFSLWSRHEDVSYKSR